MIRLQASADRRQFIQSLLAAAAASAVITPERLLAGAAPADWTLGVADVEADIAPRALTPIAGRAPADFAGVLYRNGPAKFRRSGSSAGHWFDGDGLIRRFRIADGRASLAARFADTAKRRLETQLDRIVMPGFGTAAGEGANIGNNDDANAANTNVRLLGGELLALWEGGSATRLDPETLATEGIKTFRDDLRHMPFSAHPRIEADGSVWNFGGNGKVTGLWHLGADGRLIDFAVLPLPRASYFHDFTITARHIVIVLQPWLQTRFGFPISKTMAWQPELGTQVMVVAKDDLSRRRIYELPAFSAFHYGDGWEEADGTIRFAGCLEADPTFGQSSASALLQGEYIAPPRAMLKQIVLYPDGKAVLAATGAAGEFPVSDPRRAEQPHRLTAHVTGYDGKGPFPHAIATWDWQSGRSDSFDFGADQLVEEFQYAPGNSAREGDGWLIGSTLNLKVGASELHLFRAGDVAAGPVASWRADVALPIGFHGMFVGA
ncbi:carotenoid oxygenase family protein [Erythrobacter dokdonensis]|uniref:Dioxygenase n=1 Tax=Erythrobacter dokdonensis DSW-74 TaxID=1300349 RepID=A0A1A7BF56_9SPHN|nr:carotenoid oxygenase family protein [Erythrobacter dokdonensis]OBV11158.1 Lignostilbene-alpha,beta-dioxygenase [Erythrobacter dokdonensis DSW-74]